MTSADQTEFEQFKAWKAAGSQQAPLVPERVLPTFRDVVKALVTRANLASESVVLDFNNAIDEFVDKVEKTETDDTTDEAAETPLVEEPVPADPATAKAV